MDAQPDSDGKSTRQIAPIWITAAIPKRAALQNTSCRSAYKIVLNHAKLLIIFTYLNIFVHVLYWLTR